MSKSKTDFLANCYTGSVSPVKNEIMIKKRNYQNFAKLLLKKFQQKLKFWSIF